MLDAVIIGSLKRNALTGHSLGWPGHIFEGFDYVNMSGIKFLFDLDNSLIWNI